MANKFEISVVLKAYDKITSVVERATGRTAHLLHGLEEKLEGTQKRLRKALEFPGGNAVGAIVGIASIEKLTDVYNECTKAAREQGAAQRNLRILMGNAPGGTMEAISAAQEYAERLEGVYHINHKSTMAMQAQLSTFRLAPNLVQRAILPLLQYREASKGIRLTAEDATETAEKFGRALISTGPNALKKLGIGMDESTRKQWKHMSVTQKLDVAIAQLNLRYKGLAETLAKSGGGKAYAIELQIENYQEQIGAKLLPLRGKMLAMTASLMPVITPLANALIDGVTKIADRVGKWMDKMSLWVRKNPEAVKSIQWLSDTLKTGLNSTIAAAVPIIEKIATTTLAVIRTIQEWAKANPKAAKSIGEIVVKAALFLAFIEPITKVVGWLGKLFAFGARMIKAFKWVADAIKWIRTFGIGVESLTALFPALEGVIATITGAVAALTGPVGIAIAVIAGLVAVGVYVYKHWNKVGPMFVRTGHWIVGAWHRVVGLFKSFFKFMISDAPFARILQAADPFMWLPFFIVKNWGKVKGWFQSFLVWMKPVWASLKIDGAGAADDIMKNWDSLMKWFDTFKKHMVGIWAEITKTPGFKALATMVGGLVPFSSKDLGDFWKWGTTDPNAPQARPTVPTVHAALAPSLAGASHGHSTVHVQFSNAPRGTRMKTNLAKGHSAGMGYTNHDLLNN